MNTNEKCDCLNECGDDHRLKTGGATPCPSRAKLIAENPQTEPLHWVNPTTNTMPSAFELVLLEREAGGVSIPVTPGHWDGEFWVIETEQIVTGKVTGWAAWPNGRQGGARHG